MYDPKDVRGVPISSGIPPIVIWSTIAVIILIFAIAAMVLAHRRLRPRLARRKLHQPEVIEAGRGAGFSQGEAPDGDVCKRTRAVG